MARELFSTASDGTPHKHDEATDVWAYGMVIYVRKHSDVLTTFQVLTPSIGVAHLESTLRGEAT